MADQITRKIISLKWWSLIILVGNILLGQVVDGAPVAQQFLNLLTQMPSMIQYPGLYPLTGGQTKSLVNSNFGPNEIVTGSGMPSNFFASGPSAAIDFVSKMFSTAGEALGAAASSILSGITHGSMTLVSGVAGLGTVNNVVNTFPAPISN